MRRLLGLLLPLLLAQSQPANVAERIQAGNASAERGEYAAAVAAYEQAQRLARDPGLVAFNLATVRYQQARHGNAQALGAAEVAYRCCLEPGDPRRARALFGLGNCLLLRGTTTPPEALPLRAAVDRYTECLADPSCDEASRQEALYNQQCARLLLLQTPEATRSSADEPGDTEENRQDPATKGRAPNQTQDTNLARPDPTAKPEKVGQTEREGAKAGNRSAPGRGSLGPIPESAQATALSSQEASEHLDRAWQRIRDEVEAHRRSRTRQVSPGAKDW